MKEINKNVLNDNVTRNRFQNEIQALKFIDKAQNIVRLVDSFETINTHCLIFEFCNEPNLQQRRII
jgi:serine/threonine protein kinase